MAELNYKLKLKVKYKLIKKHTDLSKCYCCNSIIYGNMYTFYIKIEASKKSFKNEKTDINLCESCSDIHKEYK
jgi:hypothetical protein